MNNSSDSQESFCNGLTHPNGRLILDGPKRPTRIDDPIFETVFPKTSLGELLKGLVVTFLIKQEHRRGWVRKSACDGIKCLDPYPNETVASHQWGVAWIIMVVSRSSEFKEEMPNFDVQKAVEMSMIHDVPELVTGDITPVDGISVDEKHRMESEAMVKILGCFPQEVGRALKQIYQSYEERRCEESKFVKDCDKLDFMLHAFLLEREGFSGFSEFYENTRESGFSTKIARDLADQLMETRNCLVDAQILLSKQ